MSRPGRVLSSFLGPRSPRARMVQRVERDRASRVHWVSGGGVTRGLFADLKRAVKHGGLRAGTGPAKWVRTESEKADPASAGASVVEVEQPAEALADSNRSGGGAGVLDGRDQGVA